MDFFDDFDVSQCWHSSTRLLVKNGGKTRGGKKKVIKDAYSDSDSSERYKDMGFSVGNLFQWLASGSFFG